MSDADKLIAAGFTIDKKIPGSFDFLHKDFEISATQSGDKWFIELREVHYGYETGYMYIPRGMTIDEVIEFKRLVIPDDATSEVE